eukprot:1162115-Pelagomonas_calceolata.AAC.10
MITRLHSNYSFQAFRLAVADALAKCAVPQPDENGNYYDNDGNPIDPEVAGKLGVEEEATHYVLVC